MKGTSITKSEKSSSKGLNPSKQISAPKIVKKSTQSKTIPAKGLEANEDDSESDPDLENEVDEENALNQLSEQHDQQTQSEDEDVTSLLIESWKEFNQFAG